MVFGTNLVFWAASTILQSKKERKEKFRDYCTLLSEDVVTGYSTSIGGLVKKIERRKTKKNLVCIKAMIVIILPCGLYKNCKIIHHSLQLHK